MQTTCPNCSKLLRAPDDAAGKRVRCPACQTVISLDGSNPEKPLASPAPVRAAPAAQWTLKTEDGQLYGPISKTELDSWVADGRVSAECQLLPTGGTQWQWASDVYPQLARASASFPPIAFDAPAKPNGGFIASDNPYASPRHASGPSSTRGRSIPNHLPLAIFALLCCGGVFAVPAIIYAAQANSHKDRGDYVAAAKAASSAQTWLIVAFCIGTIGNFIGIALQVALQTM
jgi:hypothetical protein